MKVTTRAAKAAIDKMYSQDVATVKVNEGQQYLRHLDGSLSPILPP